MTDKNRNVGFTVKTLRCDKKNILMCVKCAKTKYKNSELFEQMIRFDKRK